MNETSLKFSPSSRANAAGWFLVVTYAVGALVFALMEQQGQVMSERFDFPPVFIYAVAGIQLICVAALFYPRLRLGSLAILSILSVGAVAAHFRIGSPVTSLPAVAFTVVQLWLANHIYQNQTQ